MTLCTFSTIQKWFLILLLIIQPSTMPHLLSKEMSDLSNLSRSLELVLDFFLSFQNFETRVCRPKDPGLQAKNPGL